MSPFGDRCQAGVLAPESPPAALAVDNYREFFMKRFRTAILGIFASLSLLMLVAAPSHATSYGSDPYSFTDYQSNIGSNTGTIFYTGPRTFSAHLHVINANNCGGHHTVAMFKLDFKDGTSAFTRSFENPSQLCGQISSYDYPGEDFTQTKIITYITPRVCHIVGGDVTDCKLSSITFRNAGYFS
jgi:hypothetical protein